jgi:hypothetical protein
VSCGQAHVGVQGALAQVGGARAQGATLVVDGLAETKAPQIAIDSGPSARGSVRTPRVWQSVITPAFR